MMEVKRCTGKRIRELPIKPDKLCEKEASVRRKQDAGNHRRKNDDHTQGNHGGRGQRRCFGYS